MITLATVVEGFGEVQALPVLLRRLAADLRPGVPVDVPTPFRLPRGRFAVTGELSRAVAVASQRVVEGGVLVLADADDDCPATFGEQLRQRSEAVAQGRRVGVVLANREFEAWFLASLTSLSAHPDIDDGALDLDEPERVRDAKGRLQAHMAAAKYSATRHQPAFAARMDLDSAASCRSFRKLRSEVEKLLGA